jgi:hypothetical protein
MAEEFEGRSSPPPPYGYFEIIQRNDTIVSIQELSETEENLTESIDIVFPYHPTAVPLSRPSPRHPFNILLLLPLVSAKLVVNHANVGSKSFYSMLFQFLYKRKMMLLT